MKLRFSIAFLAVVQLFVSSCQTKALKPLIIERGEQRENDISGNWFGLSQGDLYVYYLVLSPPNPYGKRFSSVSKEVKFFQITAFENFSGRLLIYFAEDSEVAVIEGNFATDTMFHGHIVGRSGWSNTVSFYKESAFNERMQILSELYTPTNAAAKP